MRVKWVQNQLKPGSELQPHCCLFSPYSDYGSLVLAGNVCDVFEYKGEEFSV